MGMLEGGGVLGGGGQSRQERTSDRKKNFLPIYDDRDGETNVPIAREEGRGKEERKRKARKEGLTIERLVLEKIEREKTFSKRLW